jgi:hypothetical protein
MRLPTTTAFDTVLQRTRHAFRAEGEGFSGGDATYRSHVGSLGRLSIAPRGEIRRARGESLELTTSFFGRGGRALPLSQTQVMLEADGSVDIVRPDFSEHVQNTRDGVEQSWTVSSQPDGRGDLEVRVRVAGESYAGTSKHGLHFAGLDGVGLRYGNATWMDAVGRRTEIVARLEADEIALRVPHDVIERSSYPAVLDPIVSPEVGMDDPVIVHPSGGGQVPSVASDGNGFLVVWLDRREELTIQYPSAVLSNTLAYDVYGARVASDGTIVDPVGFRIGAAVTLVNWASQNFDCPAPVVAFNGTNYLVAWEDRRSADFSTFNWTLNGYGDIYGARVSTSGEVLDPKGIAIATGSLGELRPAIASDGKDWLVAWDIKGEIRAAHVAADGSVGKKLTAPPGTTTFRSRPALAFNGTSYLLAWLATGTAGTGAGDQGVFGVRVARDGTLLDAKSVQVTQAVSTGPRDSLAAASDGTNFLLAWSPPTPISNGSIRAARVSGGGALLDSTAIVVSTANGARLAPAATFDGTNYVVAWEDYRSGSSTSSVKPDFVYAARVRPNGTVLDPSGIVVGSQGATSTSQTRPALAVANGTTLAFWQEELLSPIIALTMRGGRLTSSGIASDDPAPLEILRTANSERRPAVAFGGTNYLSVWLDDRPTAGHVFAARSGLDGVVQDTQAIDLGSIAPYALSRLGVPSVGSDGTSYLVVWTNATGPNLFSAKRVDATGTILDADPIEIVSGTPTPGFDHDAAIAFGGGEYLLVFRRDHAGSGADIWGARVSVSGVPLDDGFAITTSVGDQLSPAVAFNDATGFLVTWQDYRLDSKTPSIFGARVALDGTVLDSTPVRLSSGAQPAYRPSAACTSATCLVSWIEGRDDSALIRATRVGATGAVVDSLGLTVGKAPVTTAVYEPTIGTMVNSTTVPTGPSVTALASDFVVTWERRGIPRATTLFVYSNTVSEGGVVASSGICPVAADPTVQRYPVATSNGVDTAFIAYEKIDRSAPFGSYRVRARLVQLGVCANPGDPLDPPDPPFPHDGTGLDPTAQPPTPPPPSGTATTPPPPGGPGSSGRPGEEPASQPNGADDSGCSVGVSGRSAPKTSALLTFLYAIAAASRRSARRRGRPCSSTPSSGRCRGGAG